MKIYLTQRQGGTREITITLMEETLNAAYNF